MMLYLSIVLLAAFAALPSGSGGDAHLAGGVHGSTLIALIWGTAIGLAIAHWFAFRVTARAFGGGTVSDTDVRIGLAQLVAAMIVAGLCTVPVIVFDTTSEVTAATIVLALLLGLSGFLVAKSAGRSVLRSLILGGIVMLVGLAIALLKNFLVGH